MEDGHGRNLGSESTKVDARSNDWIFPGYRSAMQMHHDAPRKVPEECHPEHMVSILTQLTRPGKFQ
jgi:hypothetical protein